MKTTNTHGVIMVKDDPTLAKAAGAMVFWRLSGGLKRPDLEQAFIDAGIDSRVLPPEITTLAALRTVMNRVATKHKAFVRSYGQHALAIAAKQTATTVQGTAHFPIVVQAGLVGFAHASSNMLASKRVFERRDNEKAGKKDDPACVTVEATSINADYDAMRDEVLGELSAARDTYEADDVGSWLVDRAKACGGVPLRNGGGIYFIPRFALDSWRELIGALQASSAGQVVYEIPALDSKGAVDAIVDALQAEAEEAIVALDASMTGAGKRALRTKAATCVDLDAKLTKYEEQLGIKLEELRAKLESLQYRLGVAALSSDEKDAAE
jgi:hypothetical protein